MKKMKLISHENEVYPLFPSLDSAFAFLANKYLSFELEDVWCLVDFCHSDDKYYWLYQIFFSFISDDDERISDSFIVCIPD